MSDTEEAGIIATVAVGATIGAVVGGGHWKGVILGAILGAVFGIPLIGGIGEMQRADERRKQADALLEPYDPSDDDDDDY